MIRFSHDVESISHCVLGGRSARRWRVVPVPSAGQHPDARGNGAVRPRDGSAGDQAQDAGPMSIRFLAGLACGLGAGYCVGRIMEARAHGVPLDEAFKRTLTPIHTLALDIGHRGQEAVRRARGIVSAPVQPDAILVPTHTGIAKW